MAQLVIRCGVSYRCPSQKTTATIATGLPTASGGRYVAGAALPPPWTTLSYLRFFPAFSDGRRLVYFWYNPNK